MEEVRSFLSAFIGLSSISTDPHHHTALRRAASLLAQQFKQLHFAAEIIETDGNPVVHAHWSGPAGAPTLLVYGHYDVQPADPINRWTSDPFLLTERDGRLYGRGIADDKGPSCLPIFALAKILRARPDLPLSVKFVFEGEEEIGSPSFRDFLLSNREKLAADAALVVDSGCPSADLPALTTGLRGLASLELRLKTANRDIHSGFGGNIPNAADEMARLCSTLHDRSGHVLVEGFYRNIRPPREEETAAFQTLDILFGDPLGDFPIKAFLDPFPRLSQRSIHALMPSLEINGIGGGYGGSGTKTIIPAEAFAKISLRIVPDQRPEFLLERLSAHLRHHCPHYADLEIIPSEGFSSPYLVDFDRATPRFLDFFHRAENALKTVFGRRPLQLREGGSIGIVSLLKEILNLDSLLVGLVPPESAIHSPDENWSLQSLKRAHAVFCEFFSSFGHPAAADSD